MKDTSIEKITHHLPEIGNILDLSVPATFVLIKPYFIDKTDIEVNGTKLLLPDAAMVDHYTSMKADAAIDAIVENRVLSSGVVVTAGQRCDEIKAGMEVYFYKSSSKGAFTSKNEEGAMEIYQLYQEYDIHAFITK